MKIAILSCFYPYRGGIAQFNAELYRKLRNEHEVRAFNFKRQYPDFLFPGKTQYVTKNDNAVPVESEFLLDTANPFTYISTARKIARWNPDVLFVRYWMPYFAPSLGYVCRRLKKKGCKVIGIVDNLIPHEKRPGDSILTRYFTGACNGFITLCDAVNQDLLHLRPDAESMVIPHPLYSHFGDKIEKEEAENRLGLQHGYRNILFFGLIREYKGLDILLEAFSSLDESYRLIIAGEPYGSFEKYEQLIARSGNRNISVFSQYIVDEEVPLFFSAADVVVLPYRSATQSGISAISYHFEIPMITTDVGGLKETIADRNTGIVVERAEPGLIREAIIRYFGQDTSGYKNSIKEEKQRLSWDNFCKKLIDFSKEL